MEANGKRPGSDLVGNYAKLEERAYANAQAGWRAPKRPVATFEQIVHRLVERYEITEEEAMAYCSRRLARMVDDYGLRTELRGVFEVWLDRLEGAEGEQ